jgi:hypothetical protein
LIKILDDASYMKDDPVRPVLSYAFRKSVGEIFYIGEDKPDAIVCVAYTTDIPTTVRELALYSHPKGDNCIAYTVWSYTPRSGRNIIFSLRDYAIENDFKRLVTLSPKTEMARKFHLSNGAFILNENQETDNYEYELYET